MAEDAVARDRRMLDSIATANERVEWCPEHNEPNLCCPAQVRRWLQAYRATDEGSGVDGT